MAFTLKNPQIPGSEAPIRTKDQILIEHPRASLWIPDQGNIKVLPKLCRNGALVSTLSVQSGIDLNLT